MEAEKHLRRAHKTDRTLDGDYSSPEMGLLIARTRLEGRRREQPGPAEDYGALPTTRSPNQPDER